jgi:hypothetical protein
MPVAKASGENPDHASVLAEKKWPHKQKGVERAVDGDYLTSPNQVTLS